MDYLTQLVEDDDMRACHCDNCDWHGRAKDTHPIVDLESRIAPGETVPVGECPECSCLAHLVEPAPDDLP